MSLDDRTVDENQAVFALMGQRIEDSFPDTALSPSHIAIINRRVRTVTVRQVSPRCACSQNVEDASHFVADYILDKSTEFTKVLDIISNIAISNEVKTLRIQT